MKIERSEMQRPLHQLLFLCEFGKNTGHVFAVIFHMEYVESFRLSNIGDEILIFCPSLEGEWPEMTLIHSSSPCLQTVAVNSP